MSMPVPTYRGFSLLEVLITMVVLSLALLALAKFQGDSLREGSEAKKRTEATALAQQRIESLRNFATPATFDGYVSGTDSHDGQTATFQRTWSISRDLVNTPKLLTLTVRVTWPDASGNRPAADNTTAENQVILTTVIAKADPSLTGRASLAPINTTGTPTTGTPTSGTPTSGTPTSGTPTSGTPTSGTPTSGTPTSGTPTSGTPTSGTPTSGTPTTGSTSISYAQCICSYQNATRGFTSATSATPTSGQTACPTTQGRCTIAMCTSLVTGTRDNNTNYTINCP